MLLGLMLFPGSARAFSGTGSGSIGDPYLVSTCSDLQSIGSTEQTLDQLYWLANDIDCSASAAWNSGAGFSPIDSFEGTLDGRGNTINGLVINRPAESLVGLFQNLNSSSMVTSLFFDATTSITGGEGVGTLAGNANGAIIRDVSADSTVTTTSNLAGGLVGLTSGWQDDMIIQMSSFTGSVSSTGWSGGLVGRAYNGFTYDDIYIDATVNGATSGGILGQGSQSCGYRYINRSLVKGVITASTASGGLVGDYLNMTCYENEINQSVSLANLAGAGARGALIGALDNSNVAITNSYFDQAQATTANCVGTIVSGSAGTCSDIGSNVAPSGEPYAQWDFAEVWQESSGTVTRRSPLSLLAGPGVPTGGSAVQGTDVNSVDVSWGAPLASGSYPVIQYGYELKEASASWEEAVQRDRGAGLSISLYELRLGVAYDIRVRAITEYATSDWVELAYTAPDPEVFTASTCEELQAFDEEGTHLDTYVLSQDIDCSGIENFQSLSWPSSFAGVFDGQGYIIYDLSITASDDYNYGLFRQTGKAVIQGVGIVGGSVTVTNGGRCGAVAGEMYDTQLAEIRVEDFAVACDWSAGGIAGYYESSTPQLTIDYLSTSGSIEASQNSGGLFGALDVYDESRLAVKKSFSSATVSSVDSRAGGLFGSVYVENDEDTFIPAAFLLQDSYSDGQVAATINAGGLIGDAETYNDGYTGVVELEIENAYSSAGVTASLSSAGGIIGYMDELQYEGEQILLNNVFAAGLVSSPNLGYALVGSSDGISDGRLAFTNAYFDQTATGQTAASDYDVSGWTAVNQDGSDASYFKNNATNLPMSAWDFDTVWAVQLNDFPVLSNSQDLNGDAVPDSEQPHVGGYMSPVTGKLVALDMGEGCVLTVDDMVVEANLAALDPAYEYDNGLFAFEADCGTPGFTTTIQLFFYDVDAADLGVRKFNPNTNAYFAVPGATLTERSIDGVKVTVATYEITDGGVLDMDGEANGIIVDPAGVARLVIGVPNTGLGARR